MEFIAALNEMAAKIGLGALVPDARQGRHLESEAGGRGLFSGAAAQENSAVDGRVSLGFMTGSFIQV